MSVAEALQRVPGVTVSRFPTGGSSPDFPSPEGRGNLIRGMDTEELVAAAEGLEVDDLADLLRDLPETVNQRVLRSMDSQDRERLSTVLSYDEDTAGGLMNTDAVSVRPDVTLETVLRYLRMRGELPDRTDALFVVNRHDRYLGSLYVTRLLTEDADRTVGEVMDTDVAGIVVPLEQRITLQGAKILVVGAGGVAKAVLGIFAKALPLGRVVIASRRPESRDSMIRHYRDKINVPLEATDSIGQVLAYCNLIVTATTAKSALVSRWAPRAAASPASATLSDSNAQHDEPPHDRNDRTAHDRRQAPCRPAHAVEGARHPRGIHRAAGQS
jgi:CBS domain-containing protein